MVEDEPSIGWIDFCEVIKHEEGYHDEGLCKGIQTLITWHEQLLE